MEYGVDAHCSWEFEAYGRTGEDLVDWEGSKPLIGELPRWSIGGDVVCIKPYFVSDVVVRGFRCVSVMETCHIVRSLPEGPVHTVVINLIKLVWKLFLLCYYLVSIQLVSCILLGGPPPLLLIAHSKHPALLLTAHSKHLYMNPTTSKKKICIQRNAPLGGGALAAPWAGPSWDAHSVEQRGLRAAPSAAGHCLFKIPLKILKLNYVILKQYTAHPLPCPFWGSFFPSCSHYGLDRLLRSTLLLHVHPETPQNIKIKVLSSNHLTLCGGRFLLPVLTCRFHLV